jgi:hypothetical protein
MTRAKGSREGERKREGVGPPRSEQKAALPSTDRLRRRKREGMGRQERGRHVGARKDGEKKEQEARTQAY